MKKPTFYFHASQNPNLGGMASMTLYEGKRVKRAVSYTIINNRQTGEFHHDSVTFKAYKRTKNDAPWEEKNSLTLANNNDQELTKALDFLNRCRQTPTWGDSGEYALYPEETPAPKAASATTSLESQLAASAQEGLKALMGMDKAHFDKLQKLVAIATYREGLERFLELLHQRASAGAFFAFFESHLWVLGLGFHQVQLNPLGLSSCLEAKGSSERLTLYWVVDLDALFEGNLPSSELNAHLVQAQDILMQMSSEIPQTPIELKLLGGQIPAEEQAMLQRLNRHFKDIEVVSLNGLYEQAKTVLSQKQREAKSAWDS